MLTTIQTLGTAPDDLGVRPFGDGVDAAETLTDGVAGVGSSLARPTPLAPRADHVDFVPLDILAAMRAAALRSVAWFRFLGHDLLAGFLGNGPF